MKYNLFIRCVLISIFALTPGIISPASAADTIKLGIAGAHTGDLASYGLPTVHAAELIVKKVNAQGGILGKKVELFIEDDACKPELATNVATKLVSSKAHAVIGRHTRSKSGILGAIFRPPATHNEEKAIVDKSYAILEDIGLANYANDLAKNLSYGAQRRLEIARALATEPRVLLLDEPAAGMNPQETRELEGLLEKLLACHELSILLIEHDMKLVMNLAQNIFVLDYGEEIARGTPQEIRHNPAVIKAYLGEEADVEVS